MIGVEEQGYGITAAQGAICYGHQHRHASHASGLAARSRLERKADCMDICCTGCAAQPQVIMCAATAVTPSQVKT